MHDLVRYMGGRLVGGGHLKCRDDRGRHIGRRRGHRDEELQVERPLGLVVLELWFPAGVTWSGVTGEVRVNRVGTAVTRGVIVVMQVRHGRGQSGCDEERTCHDGHESAGHPPIVR